MLDSFLQQNWDIDNRNTLFFLKTTMNSLASPTQLSCASLEQARVALNAHAHHEKYIVAIRCT